MMLISDCCYKWFMVNKVSLTPDFHEKHTYMVKIGRRKDVGQLPQDDFLASAHRKVVVCRDGHVPDLMRMVNERADLLVCSHVPE